MANSDDYRGKRVLFREDATGLAGRGEPHSLVDLGKIGQIGVARSIYEDGRACHDEAYLVEFPDGVTVACIEEELDLVEDFVLGDKVYDYGVTGRYGQVTSVSPDGSFEITWDDDMVEMVAEHGIHTDDDQVRSVGIGKA